MKPRVAVTGPDSINSGERRVFATLREYWPNESSPRYWDGELVTGDRDGVEAAATKFAEKHGVCVTSLEPYEPQNIAEYADYLIVVWSGEDERTRAIIDAMLDQGKSIYVSGLEE